MIRKSTVHLLKIDTNFIATLYKWYVVSAYME